MEKLNPKMQKYIYIQLFLMTIVIFFLKLFEVKEERYIIILMIVIGSVTLIILKKRLEKTNK